MSGWTPAPAWLDAALRWRELARPGSGHKRRVYHVPPPEVVAGLEAEGLYDRGKVRRQPPTVNNAHLSARVWARRIDAFLALVHRRETAADRADRAAADRIEFEIDRLLPPPPQRYRVIRLLQIRYARRLTRARRHLGRHVLTDRDRD